MNLLCIAAAGVALSLQLPEPGFTLRWMHSIEKVAWEEDYRIVGDRLALTEARIRGSGAGMEPPDGAVLRDGAWHYVPALPLLPRLHLARSDFTADYQLCVQGRCRPMSEFAGPAQRMETVDLYACDAAAPLARTLAPAFATTLDPTLDPTYDPTHDSTLAPAFAAPGPQAAGNAAAAPTQKF